jgi:hypothetical protein
MNTRGNEIWLGGNIDRGLLYLSTKGFGFEWVEWEILKLRMLFNGGEREWRQGYDLNDNLVLSKVGEGVFIVRGRSSRLEQKNRAQPAQSRLHRTLRRTCWRTGRSHRASTGRLTHSPVAPVLNRVPGARRGLTPGVWRAHRPRTETLFWEQFRSGPGGCTG